MMVELLEGWGCGDDMQEHGRSAESDQTIIYESNCTFEALEGFLEKLGFVREASPQAVFNVFRHPDGHESLLPLRGRGELVSPLIMEGKRYQLLAFGLLQKDAVDTVWRL